MARIQDFEQFIKVYNPEMENDDIKRYEIHEKTHMFFVNTQRNLSPNNIWTVVDGDNGKWYLTPGYHYVNRLFYVFTNKPFKTETQTRDYLW